MKKAMLILIGLLLSLMLRLPAFADGETDGSDTITAIVKETVKEEETTITKNIEIGVNQNTFVEQSAETSNTGSVDNSGNEIAEINVDSSAIIQNSSFNGVDGIISINQAPGSMNNQGNSVSISFAKDGADTLLRSASSFDQSSLGNTLTAEDSIHSNTIKANAFNSLSGVIGINQSAGNLNSQNNIACISTGGNPVVSLSPAELGMISGHNTVFEAGVSNIDTISSFAFEGVSGIISINQSSGSLNNQINVVTISVHTFP
ncbi:MAG: hypothetical protein JRD93_06380 [Deltaproteobacteria bacterium]|nr:hypothetical protein [Deltaproteobacteria bacterium]MBW2661603.1 hypothetical protein [Deltaproteobacteria bacterium]